MSNSKYLLTWKTWFLSKLNLQPPKVRELEGKVKDTEAITVKVGSNLSDQFGMKPDLI